jgi:heme-degrading monooxygenase HmoA
MIVVLFEARAHRAEDYLDLAAALLPEAQAIDGFMGIERFQSLADPTKLLSLSLWRDEEAIARWRAHAGHRAAQARGRSEIFANYRLRVAHIVRDYGSADRTHAPVW